MSYQYFVSIMCLLLLLGVVRKSQAFRIPILPRTRRCGALSLLSSSNFCSVITRRAKRDTVQIERLFQRQRIALFSTTLGNAILTNGLNDIPSLVGTPGNSNDDERQRQFPSDTIRDRSNDRCDGGFRVTAPFSPTGDQPEAIRRVLEQLQDQKSPVAILRGCTGTGKTLVVAHVLQGLQKPALVLCHNKTLAAQLARELRAFLGHSAAVELFVSYYNHFVPESYVESKGRYISKKSSISQVINSLRHSATRALLTQRNVVVVATVSCIYGLGLPEEYLNASVEWSTNQILSDSSPSSFFQSLRDMQYQPVNGDQEFEPGTYLHTTSLTREHSSESPEAGNELTQHKVVLWPPYERFPLTIRANEYVSSNGGSNNFQIISLEQGTAQGLTSVESLRIFPARHHVQSSDSLLRACLDIEDELSERVKELNSEKNFEAAARLQKRVLNDLNMLRETGFCSGLENYSRHLTGRKSGEPPETLLDFFARTYGKGVDNWLLVVDESHVTLPQLSAMYRGDQARKQSLIRHGYRLRSALDNRPLKDTEFWERIPQTLFVSATPGHYELELLQQVQLPQLEPVPMVIRPTHVCDPVIEVRSVENCLQDLAREIQRRIDLQERTLVMALTKRDAEDLASFLSETHQIKTAFLHSGLGTDDRSNRLRCLQSGDVDCLVGVNCLREGLDLPQVSLVAVLNADSGGFLRSETALLQTVGRAARNKNGYAIFYAERITIGMEKCMAVTGERRQTQLLYNAQHGFEPKSTKGSSMMSLFDLLKDQIEVEQNMSKFEGQVDELLNVAATLTGSTRTTANSISTDHIPSSPGVYFWKDKTGTILYIGKAAKLRARIRSYLAPGAKHSGRIKTMIEKAVLVEFILTPSERDALVLESNLIKAHQPPFNIVLKDDEHYPYICASIGDKLPRFFIAPNIPPEHQNISTSRYRYFGPYTSFKEINAVLDAIEENYGLRTKLLLVRHGSGSVEEYNALFQKALSEVFSPRSSSELRRLRSEYEEAGLLFDSALNRCRDVVAVASVKGSNTQIIVQVVQMRQGYVSGSFSYTCDLPSGVDNSVDVLGETIQTVLESRHYLSCKEVPDQALSWFPDDVLLPYEVPDSNSLRKTIRQARAKVEPDRKRPIVVKTRSTKGDRALVDEKALKFAEANAVEYAAQSAREGFVTTSVDGTAAKQLAELLSLDRLPSRIECYDVSHTKGDHTVASRVVFVDGKPAPYLYRIFNIKTVHGVDDYASITEVLERRFKRAREFGNNNLVNPTDPWAIPDLVVIDGGRGQLGAAIKGISQANIFPKQPNGGAPIIPVCALAKNKEEIFVPHSLGPLNDSPNSPALLLLRHLRDESHRFALQAHRNLRSIRANMP